MRSTPRRRWPASSPSRSCRYGGAPRRSAGAPTRRRRRRLEPRRRGPPHLARLDRRRGTGDGVRSGAGPQPPRRTRSRSGCSAPPRRTRLDLIQDRDNPRLGKTLPHGEPFLHLHTAKLTLRPDRNSGRRSPRPSAGRLLHWPPARPVGDQRSTNVQTRASSERRSSSRLNILGLFIDFLAMSLRVIALFRR